MHVEKGRLGISVMPQAGHVAAYGLQGEVARIHFQGVIIKQCQGTTDIGMPAHPYLGPCPVFLQPLTQSASVL